MELCQKDQLCACIEARSINLLGFPGDGMAVFRAIVSWQHMATILELFADDAWFG